MKCDFLIESVLVYLLFSLVVGYSMNANPLNWISDYPPKIGERCKELGLIDEIQTIKIP